MLDFNPLSLLTDSPYKHLACTVLPELQTTRRMCSALMYLSLDPNSVYLTVACSVDPRLKACNREGLGKCFSFPFLLFLMFLVIPTTVGCYTLPSVCEAFVHLRYWAKCPC